jgi:hypothetical protein
VERILRRLNGARALCSITRFSADSVSALLSRLFGFDFKSVNGQNHLTVVIHIDSFLNQRLGGVFIITEIELTHEPLEDALGREAIAQTRILGREFRLVIHCGLTDEELSISLYHEILEAATVATSHPPAGVLDLNEAGFESAARHAHQSWGEASVENLNRMLQFYGFRGE